jgi:hypothetical protein
MSKYYRQTQGKHRPWVGERTAKLMRNGLKSNSPPHSSLCERTSRGHSDLCNSTSDLGLLCDKCLLKHIQRMR